MYISTSHISMTSSRNYSQVTYVQKEELITDSSKAAEFSLSDKGKSAAMQLKSYKEELAKKQEEENKKDLEEAYSNMLLNSTSSVGEPEMSITSMEELKMKLIQRLMESFMKRKGREMTTLEQEMRGENKLSASNQFKQIGASNKVSIPSLKKTNQDAATVLKRITAVSGFQDEIEQTAYQANGVVTTKDGRNIEFGITVEMSRSFCQKFESVTMEDFVLTDPLVINLNSNVVKVTDQKFLFDLDSTGENEEMSFAGAGSGFLALDKNGDGVINDGSELFGTKSGDGFKDLSLYDQDGNGWIDEADDIFKHLRVWTKDEKGQDYLMSLKAADVGAIYLNSASTEFSLNEMESNKTNAVIRNTGVYLKESTGMVGTIQHVDFAV